MISQLSFPYSSHNNGTRKHNTKAIGVKSNCFVYNDCVRVLACVPVLICSLFLFTSSVNTFKQSGYSMYQLL